MCSGEDDVRADQRPRAEVEPVPLDLQLQHADVRVLITCVGCPTDHRPSWASNKQESDRGHDRRKGRGASDQPHCSPFDRSPRRRYRSEKSNATSLVEPIALTGAGYHEAVQAAGHGRKSD